MKTETFTLKSFYNGLKTVFIRTRAYRGRMLFVLFLGCIFSALFPTMQYVFTLIVDALNTPSSYTLAGYTLPTYIWLFILWLILTASRIFVHRSRAYAATNIAEYCRRSYENDVLRHVLHLPLDFHKNEKRGELADIIGRGTNAIVQIHNNFIFKFAPEIVGILVTLFIALTIKPIFLWIFLVSIIVYGSAVYYFNKPAAALQRETQTKHKEANGYAGDILNNIRTVKDYAKEDTVSAHLYDLYLKSAIPTWLKLMKLRQFSATLEEFILLISRLICLSLSIYFIVRGEMTVGEIVALNYFSMRIYMPISELSSMWKEVQNGVISLEESEQLMKLQTERTDYIYEDFENGNVAFQNVTFGYSADQPVLKNISFEALHGKLTAIVGESGVGKSTLIDLLLGYNEAQNGKILIDNKRIEDLNLKSLRQDIAIVNQETTLFNDSIKNNLLYAKEDATIEELEYATKKAHIYEFIQGLPQTWDQLVGERGIKLSVGQKQRLSIARAILKNPKILILDEPTSALDASSERAINDSLADLIKGKTSIVIAHRLSTVRAADNIVVLKNGTVIEQGNHETLIANITGEYRRLYDLQIGLHE